MLSFFKIHPMKLLVLSTFALLIFILNIPGTIALRNILAVVLLVTLAFIFLKSETSIQPMFKNQSFRPIILVLLILSIYIFFHSIFIADEVSWSLSQYRTQWIYPMLYFIIGIFLAFFASLNKYFNKETLINTLFCTLLLHILYLDSFAIYQYIQTGQLLTRYGGLTGSPVLANYITNILISMIIVEFIYRFRTKKRIILFNMALLFLILLLCIFSSIIEGMRFGAISLFFMFGANIFFLIYDNKKLNKKLKTFISLFLFILCILPLSYNAKSDDRWASLIETISIVSSDTSNYWMIKEKDWDISEVPKLASGEMVAHSNYARVAWIVKGFEYISKDVFGIGYGKNIFGHAAEKYEDNFNTLRVESVIQTVRGMHSHSSIIDFTIGVGLIGLLIWSIFISRIIIYSFRIYFNTNNYFALLTIFITTGFFMRSIVDSNMRDHMFKQFFLILGISITLLFYEHNKRKKYS